MGTKNIYKMLFKCFSASLMSYRCKQGTQYKVYFGKSFSMTSAQRRDLAFICCKYFRKIYFLLNQDISTWFLCREHSMMEKKKKKKKFLGMFQTLTHSFRHKVYFYISPENYRAKDSNFILCFLGFFVFVFF